MALASLPFMVGAACANLGDIRQSECGNHVVESDAGEDCEPRPGNGCIEAGAANECRWSCTHDDDCLAHGDGWRCGRDGVCRRPSGLFAEMGLSLAVGEAAALQSGDFDGDRRDDVVTTNEATLQVHYLRGDGEVLQRTAVASVVAPSTPPVIGRFTPSDHDDLAVAYDGIVILRGGSDQQLHPALASPFTSTLLPLMGMAVTSMEAMPTLRTPSETPPVERERYRGPELLALVGLPFGTNTKLTAFVSVDTGRYAGQTLGALGVIFEVLPEDLAHLNQPGDVIEDPLAPCDELVLAAPVAGNPERYKIEIHRSCVADGAGQWAWNAGEFDESDFEDPNGTIPIPVPRIGPVAFELPAEAGRIKQLLLHDLNSDGHLDLLLSAATDGQPACTDGMGTHMTLGWVGYGLGNGHFHSTPPPVGTEPADADDTLVPIGWLCDTVLAIDDLNEDGRVDLVTSSGVYQSTELDALDSALQDRSFDFQALNRTWSVAAVGQFNADPHLDVVAASDVRPGLDYLNGAGRAGFTLAELPALGSTQSLSVGDFDGDLVLDVAMATGADVPNATQQLLVAFGNAIGPPTDLQSIGAVTRVRSMAAAPMDVQGTFDAAAELLVVSEVEGMSQATPPTRIVRPTVSVLPGRASRMLVAPHYLMSSRVPGRVDTPRVLSPAHLGMTGPWTQSASNLAEPLDHTDLAVLATRVDADDRKGITVWPTWCSADGAMWSEQTVSFSIPDTSAPGGPQLTAEQGQLLVEQWVERPATLPILASLNLDGDEFDEQVALGRLPDLLAPPAAWSGFNGYLISTKLPPAVDELGPTGTAGPTQTILTRERFAQRFESQVLAPYPVAASDSVCPGGAGPAETVSPRIDGGIVRGAVVTDDVDAQGDLELLALGLVPDALDPTVGQTVLVVLRADDLRALGEPEQGESRYAIRSFEVRDPTVDGQGEPPVLVCGITAFALLDADEDPEREIVVLTRQGAYLANLGLDPPELRDAHSIPGAAGGTAVVAADFDGDGVDDLAIVDMSGTLRFFRGTPQNWN